MGGLGACPCCKLDKLLTEHHSSELGEKIMVCRDCHNVIEEYFKLIDKYRKLSETPKEQTTPPFTAPTAENTPKL